MFEFQIPRNYAEALRLDEQNENTRWQDCTELELQELQEYNFSVTKEKVERYFKATRRLGPT